MIDYGFTLDDVGRMETELDIRDLMHIDQAIEDRKEIDRLLNLLDVAEAVAMGYARCQDKRNEKNYMMWRSSVIARVRKLEGFEEKKPVIWDKMKRSRRF